MNKIFLILFLVILIVGAIGFFLTHQSKEDDSSTSKVYSGPVRPSDDEDYFRKTGVTKPLENN